MRDVMIGRPGSPMRTTSPRPTLRWSLAVGRAVLRRPSLWFTALGQVFRLAPRRWWRRSPHLPLPTDTYLAFRSQTMYGDQAQLPEAADVVTYLAWCRDFPRAVRG